MDGNPQIRNFASELTGAILPNGWRVVRAIDKAPNATGSTFSKAYVVTGSGGQEAFLKAIDLASALNHPPPVFRELERMLRAFRYEVDLVGRCAESKMDRIVRVLDHGDITLEDGNAFSTVPYLIFEMATGDAHAFLDFSVGIDIAWVLRTLHEVAVGITQLHQQQIAHQDIKPSNVIVFDNDGSKVGDLGRASSLGHPIDHDALDWAGDGKYSPPELLYGFLPAEWTDRRFGCDAYMFGGLVLFLTSGLCIASEVQQRLPPELRRGAYTGSYQDLIPFLKKATNELILSVEATLPVNIRSELGAMLRSLLEPDVAGRGHPSQRRMKHGNRFDLRRYVTELDVLRRRAESAAIQGMRRK